MVGALTRWSGALLWAGHGLRHALAAPPRRDLAERLATIPRRGLPLRAPVRIFWDCHHVPFIDAEHDADLAVALGLVHAHLRLAQLELLRHASRGRLAEMVGPLAADLDHGLRLIDYGRAVPAIAAALPDDTRVWLEGFVAGINHYTARVEALPPELGLLGLGRRPWRIEDVLAIGRLAATDVTWLVWLRLLGLRGAADWPAPWRALIEASLSITADEPTPAGLEAALLGAARSGSNAFAVAGRRSASGAPLVAADPHLAILRPSVWLAAAYRAPGVQAAGLMVPGLPFIAIGRNPALAWAGTNLHAASSDLVDVSGLAAADIRVRRERIAVRWGRPREVGIRETAFGPILTDLPLLRWSGPETLALRWVGHRASDEITAMLRLNRARGRDELRAAVEGFAVPGLTFVCADADGRIGRVTAAHLPARPPAPPAHPFARPDQVEAWRRLVGAGELPVVLDPPEGYVVSANEAPRAPAPVLCGTFFSPDDRCRRMAELIEAAPPLSPDAALRLLQDVLHRPALALRDALAGPLRDAAAARRVDGPEARLAAAVAAWDGRYDAGSAGALAFELVLNELTRALVPAARRRVYAASWQARTLLARDLAGADPAAVAAALRRGLPRAACRFARFRFWGEMHRVRPLHPLALTPRAGRRFAGPDLPAAGSSETLLKTAHGLTDRRHVAGYGSTARLVADLADADATRVVLLGGQDGWPGSDTADDQIALWQAGDSIRLPLTAQAARRRAAHCTVLTP